MDRNSQEPRPSPEQDRHLNCAMSGCSRTTQGGADFDDLCRGFVKNYSFNPADIVGQIDVKAIKQKLIKQLQSTVNNLELEVEAIKEKLVKQLESTISDLELQSDRTIAKIYIGKTYIHRRKRPGGGYLTFDPLNSYTWRKKGISSRWQDHKKEDYGRDGLVVLGAITRETMPERCRESGQIDQEDFALAMEQKLLHHYLLSHPDPRVVNDSFSTGRATEDRCYAYAVYMAFRYEDKYDETFSEEEETNTLPFSPREASEYNPSTSSAQRQTTNTTPRPSLTAVSYMNSKQQEANPSPTMSDDMAPGPSHTPADQFSFSPPSSLKQGELEPQRISVIKCPPRQQAAGEEANQTLLSPTVSQDTPVQNETSLSLSQPFQSTPSPTRTSQVTFSNPLHSSAKSANLSLNVNLDNQQLITPTENQASVSGPNNSFPSTTPNKGILKQTPEKQLQQQPPTRPSMSTLPSPSCSSSAQNLDVSINAERSSLNKQQAERTNLQQAVTMHCPTP